MIRVRESNLYQMWLDDGLFRRFLGVCSLSAFCIPGFRIGYSVS